METMQEQRCRRLPLPVDQQHAHLAVTALAAVMRTWAVRMCQPGLLQVECTGNLESRFFQLLNGPQNCLFSGLFKGNQWRSGKHTELQDTIKDWLSLQH